MSCKRSRPYQTYILEWGIQEKGFGEFIHSDSVTLDQQAMILASNGCAAKAHGTTRRRSCSFEIAKPTTVFFNLKGI